MQRKSVEKFETKVREISKRSRNLDGVLIAKVNQVIRGTARYFATHFSHTANLFRRLDNLIRMRLRCVKMKCKWTAILNVEPLNWGRSNDQSNNRNNRMIDSTPVITAPGTNRVFPLEPEFIVPQDGHAKQDCENAAAKRWLQTFRPRYRDWGITDDLYCRQPLCEAILAQGMSFILVCKPDSHATLYEWVDGLEATNGVKTVTVTRRKGKRVETDTYRFCNNVPLRDGDDALEVNWCELTTRDADGKIVYKNAFTTNHAIDEGNIAEIVRTDRARWKVENENNNTLKTKGYHLTHNFGHGKQYFSAVLATLNLFAILVHTVLELTDADYQCVRKKLGTRVNFFNDIRALTRYLCFDS
jgi:Group II intron, maturase-specific domain